MGSSVRRWCSFALAAVLVAAVDAPVVQAVVPPRPLATLADGTMVDQLVSSSLSAPVAVAALSDGRAVVLEQGGRVRLALNGVVQATPALTLSVCANGERGLLGVAPDPAFGANGYVYLYFTRPAPGAPGGCVNRVSRFTLRGSSIDPASQVVLLDNIGSPAGNHNGGDVAIGNDGYLYVSVGDGGCDPRGDSGCAGSNNAAQDLSLLNGKILRVDRTSGAPAPGNPFAGAGTASCRVRGNTPATPLTICQEIFAYGLRNPWRFAFDPDVGSTRFFINDVGQGTREEVNAGTAGANYGWPMREGACPQGQNPPCAGPTAGLTDPLVDYPRTRGAYVTGGAFVPRGAWASGYDGSYLFADGNPGRIFRRTAGGAVDFDVPFATGVGGISDIDFVMESTGWALYYVLPGSGQLRRITQPATAEPDPGPLAFVPTASRRVFDSRNRGGESGPVRAGTTRLVNVTDGAARGSHRQALVNLTMVRPASVGVLWAWQARTPRTLSSALNGDALQITANTAVVPIDSAGNIVVLTNATSHVLVDVVGFFDVTTGGASTFGRYVPTNPAVAADTATPSGGSNLYSRTPGAANESVVNVSLAGRFGITSGANAVALLVTAVGATTASGGHITVVPQGAAVPSTSSVNVNGLADVRTNLVVVPLGGDGSVDVRLRSVANVVVAVVGSFTGSGAPSSTAGAFVAIAPSRAVDTRYGTGFTRPGANGSGTVNPTAVPDDALGVMQNVAMVAAAAAGAMKVYPAGLVPAPNADNVRTVAAGQTRGASAITRLGSGSLRVDVSVATHVLVDITGYFTSGAPA